MPDTEEKTELNLKQETFCKLFASDREFFGNGVQSYIEAYDPDTTKKGWYAAVRASSSRLLTNVNVLKRIDEILELNGLNDEFVDKQLNILITQQADFSSKLGAIREYNKLKKRVTDRLEHTGKDGDAIETNMSITYMPEPYPDDFFKPAGNSADNNSQ